MNPSVIARACGATLARATAWAPHLAEAFALWGIDTPRRQAAALAQIGHESMYLGTAREVWGPTTQQLRYERNFNAPWPASPEQARLPAFAVNRLAYGLGNSQAGDGSLFRGRSLIQTTGRTNYLRASTGIRKVIPDAPDFLLQPEALEQPRWAAHGAGFFWQSNGLNRWCDSGTDADFETLTRRINGGTNGLDDRRRLWIAARAALGV